MVSGVVRSDLSCATSAAARGRVCGGSSNAGPCSLGFADPTEVQCFPHRGVLEGEVGDSDPPTPDGPEQGLYRQALLEHRVF